MTYDTLPEIQSAAYLISSGTLELGTLELKNWNGKLIERRTSNLLKRAIVSYNSKFISIN